MSQYYCPECATQIFEKVPFCPKCGLPISDENLTTKPNIVTTQETSKTLKIHSLISGLLMIVGFGMTVAGSRTGDMSPWMLFLIFIGLVWFIITRFRIWWHHK